LPVKIASLRLRHVGAVTNVFCRGSLSQ
jgi:hypothetical protein